MKLRGRYLLAVSCLLLLALLFFAVPALAAAFGDVPASHPYYAAVTGMAERGIIGGYANGNFGPSNPVTRQQFAKMVDLTMGLAVQESDFPNVAVPFVDLGPDDLTSLYPHEYVAVCALNHITTGKTATTFEPLSTVTRQQVISMIVRAADNLAQGTLRAVPSGWTGKLSYTDPNHGANIQKAEYNGLLDVLSGGNLQGWDVGAKATRGEVAQMLWNLLKLRETPAAQPVWTDLEPAAPPYLRNSHATVYLPASNKVLMFGGIANSPTSALWDDATWSYDLATNAWSNLQTPAPPLSRWGHAMVYCPPTGKVILFGGHSFPGGVDTDLNDLWSYDPATNAWTRLNPGGSLPPVRADHMMVYVPATGKIIVLGGMYLPTGAQSYKNLSDMWSYDPMANSWTELHPSPMPAVKSGCLEYDPSSKKVILFGGTEAGGPVSNGLWTYDPVANTWTKVAPAGTVPTPRRAFASAFDTARGELIVFGGLATEQLNVVNETWSYKPATNTWTQLHPPASPRARYSTSMVYAATAKRMILFGGQPVLNGYDKLADTWALSQ
jgi:N-acetylneuraminic acid mutarotase